MDEVYRNPEYYEIAFSFRDLEQEVDVMEESIQWFSTIPVKRVFEVACGNAPHVKEWVRRGYHYVGIDINDIMLSLARRKSEKLGDKALLLQADMTQFTLDEPVDFAYVMLASLYLDSTQQLVQHFDCMARAIRPGGLYFLDWCIEFDPFSGFVNAWEVEKAGIKVQTTYMANLIDRVEQLMEEKIILEVDDQGTRKTLTQETKKRAIYPQEFLTFLKWRGDFEFVGWWNDWDLTIPVDGRDTISRPVTVIRRVER